MTTDYHLHADEVIRLEGEGLEGYRSWLDAQGCELCAGGSFRGQEGCERRYIWQVSIDQSGSSTGGGQQCAGQLILGVYMRLPT